VHCQYAIVQHHNVLRQGEGHAFALASAFVIADSLEAAYSALSFDRRTDP
jgi:hypothetical protein